MQTFYTQLFSNQENQSNLFEKLLAVAHAKLEDVLAVKAAPAWEIWEEGAEASQA
jgi:hypothetical protein